MTIEGRLSVSELGDVSDDKSLARVRLVEVSPLETTVDKNYEPVIFDREVKATAGLVIEGILVAGTATSVVLPLTLMQNQELAIGIAMVGGVTFGTVSALLGMLEYGMLKNYFAVRSQKKKAQKLTEEGYVFAHQLEDSIIVPSAVGAVDTLPTSSNSGMFRTPSWFAVKEQYVSAPVTPLSEVGNYIGETVIVPVQVTAVGDYSDMKLAGRGEFSGAVMGVFPLQMSGTIDGRVFTEDVTFRIGDSEGNSIPAYLGYLAPHLREQLPLQLRSYSPITRNVSAVDKTQLANFLKEAFDKKRQLTLLGKLDQAGNFNMEALADPRTKQAYALAVYQPNVW